MSDYPPMMSDYAIKVIEWLKDHPHSSAREVTAGCRFRLSEDRFVYSLLESAEGYGYVQRSRSGPGPWQWEAVVPQ